MFAQLASSRRAIANCLFQAVLRKIFRGTFWDGANLSRAIPVNTKIFGWLVGWLVGFALTNFVSLIIIPDSYQCQD